ncbi:MAG: hypothetical protein LUE27_06875 [Clostridia bacterium]|nr:hypothetical protein [Clostridia bacterium]
MTRLSERAEEYYGTYEHNGLDETAEALKNLFIDCMSTEDKGKQVDLYMAFSKMLDSIVR